MLPARNDELCNLIPSLDSAISAVISLYIHHP